MLKKKTSACLLGLTVSIIILYFLINETSCRRLEFTLSNSRFTGFLIGSGGSSNAQDKLVICSHGTNSHKEVFIPLAWELSNRGFTVFTLDSPTLSTDEGIKQRIKEIGEALATYEKQIGKKLTKVCLIGHSDGVPPSLAFKKMYNGAPTSCVIMGSYLTESGKNADDVAAAIGGFDQVFPPAEVLRSLRDGVSTKAPFIVSWLSDHFTEQYDPILIGGISNLFSPNDASFPSISIGFRVLIFSMAMLFAFSTGIFMAVEFSLTGRIIGFIASMLFWAATASFPWFQTIVPIFLLGAVIGPQPGRRACKIMLYFALLMGLNITLTSIFFWKNFLSSAPWLIPAIPWYFIAWTAKISFFIFSIMERTNFSPFPAMPSSLFILGLTATIFPGGIGNFFSRITLGKYDTTEKTQPDKSRTLAFSLFGIMLFLWVLRFRQGMLQMEILESVLENFLRMLVLPGSYLLLIATGRLSVPVTAVKSPQDNTAQH